MSIKVIFKTPGSDFDANSIDEGFIKIPKAYGIYISGIKIKLDTGECKFCPLIVGQGDLRNRLGHHWSIFTHDADLRDIYDFKNGLSVQDVKDRYQQMEKVDGLQKYKGSKKIEKLKQYIINKKGQDELNHLLFFNHQSYFGFKNVPITYDDNSGFLEVLNQLDLNKSNNYVSLREKIIAAKEIFRKQFYCVYSEISEMEMEKLRAKLPKLPSSIKIKKLEENYAKSNDPKTLQKIEKLRSEKLDRYILETIENSVKEALYKLNIATTAKSHNRKDDFDIDLSAISAELINLYSESEYNSHSYTYNRDLIVKMR